MSGDSTSARCPVWITAQACLGCTANIFRGESGQQEPLFPCIFGPHYGPAIASASKAHGISRHDFMAGCQFATFVEMCAMWNEDKIVKTLPLFFSISNRMWTWSRTCKLHGSAKCKNVACIVGQFTTFMRFQDIAV